MKQFWVAGNHPVFSIMMCVGHLPPALSQLLKPRVTEILYQVCDKIFDSLVLLVDGGGLETGNRKLSYKTVCCNHVQKCASWVKKFRGKAMIQYQHNILSHFVVLPNLLIRNCYLSAFQTPLLYSLVS